MSTMGRINHQTGKKRTAVDIGLPNKTPRYDVGRLVGLIFKPGWLSLASSTEAINVCFGFLSSVIYFDSLSSVTDHAFSGLFAISSQLIGFSHLPCHPQLDSFSS